MTATVRAAGLRDFIHLVTELGGDARRLCHDCGVDVAIFEDDESLLPYRQLVHLMEHSAAALGVPDLGLRLAAGWKLDILGPLALAMQNSATVDEALHCAASHLFFHSSALELIIHPQGDLTRVQLRICLRSLSDDQMCQVNDKSIGFLHRILGILAGDAYRPVSVSLPHEPRAPESVYRRFFGVPVTFGSHGNMILMNTDCLATPIKGHNEQLHRMATQYLQDQYPTPQESVSSRVKIAIRQTLGTASCNRDDIARSLAIHPRTLQRKLENEGVSFNELRDNVRRERAEYYLRKTRLPLAQVAGTVGYSDQSMLTRSCRRWFGVTPRQVRRIGTAQGGEKGAAAASSTRG